MQHLSQILFPLYKQHMGSLSLETCTPTLLLLDSLPVFLVLLSSLMACAFEGENPDWLEGRQFLYLPFFEIQKSCVFLKSRLAALINNSNNNSNNKAARGRKDVSISKYFSTTNLSSQMKTSVSISDKEKRIVVCLAQNLSLASRGSFWSFSADIGGMGISDQRWFVSAITRYADT